MAACACSINVSSEEDDDARDVEDIVEGFLVSSGIVVLGDMEFEFDRLQFIIIGGMQLVFMECGKFIL